ncbi:SMC-Scp complex subunit ScpB [Candidatus Sumerlaeota bacterium]|nr:SMC-Scp complex subunit ScpB [Candidatus Sumerlaeota bacterium]
MTKKTTEPPDNRDADLPPEDRPPEIDRESAAEDENDEDSPQSAMAYVEEVDFSVPIESEEPEAEISEIEEEEAFVEDMPEAALFETPDELKSAVECLLFTTSHPLSLNRLRAILGDVDSRTLRGAVAQIQAEYDARTTGLQIVETAEGYLMCTRPEYADVILRLHRQRKRNPLTVTALETLAIVAYKQPITRAEIEMIRGVESSGVLRNLCDMGLVKVVGRKEVIGRPQLHGTTSVFLRTFGLRSLEELPTLQTLRKRYGSKVSFAETMTQAVEEIEPPTESPADESPPEEPSTPEVPPESPDPNGQP